MMSEASPSEAQPRSVTIVDGNCFTIPPDFRTALGVAPGDVVVAEVVGGELHIRPFTRDVARAQAYVRTLVPEGVSLVDDLIADRRLDAARD